MQRGAWVSGAFAVCLASAGIVAAAGQDAVGAARPHVALRATPRTAFPPANVFVVAELKGRPGEEFYCPGIEWEWGDGSRSAEEGDCPPYSAGAEVERFYSARHAYGTPGNYDLTLTMRRADRTLAAASLQIVVVGSNIGR